MQFLVSLSEIRDIFIIIYGVLGILFFFIGIIVAVVVGLTIKGLIKSVRELMDETLKPTMTSIQETAASIKDTADTVRGTTEFVGRTAVAPVLKTYGAFAGVKKGFGVLSGIKGRGKKS